ncbi:conserved hypothetical protein [Vibrio chagasii]|nr:conserved hypothetical protein [Vibrio chagasii]
MNTSITKKKNNDILALVGAGGFIQYATSDEQERAKALKGRVVAIKPKKAGSRCLKYHRRFFALIRLGFTYWSPHVSLVSDPESAIAHAVAKRFCTLGGNPELYELQGKEIADLVLSDLKGQREGIIDVEAYKCEEAYRKQVMIDAGFFEFVNVAGGGVIKVPWSIAFDNMQEDDFRKIYRGCHDVIWQKSLFQIFDNQEEMDKAVDQLMVFI